MEQKRSYGLNDEITIYVDRYYDDRYYQLGRNCDLAHLLETERNFKTPENAFKYAEKTLLKALKSIVKDMEGKCHTTTAGS